ncbi:hypothetical protein GHT06_019015 [Daphnia sinensis]|uniref:Uncharacterized protein n=1 Tax=Daphnia sinensis TaxID=1820382 RepID=A0AAD5PNW5_9CRUS|nr:hypothetical protein GHT06_019015 [Daphnia sinensis]
MCSPPSHSESRLRDLALRTDSAARARQRRADSAPSIDSRVGETEEGDVLDIHGSHQNVDEVNEEPRHQGRRRTTDDRGGRVSRSPSASRSRSRSRSPFCRSVDTTVVNFTVSASKTRLIRKWMVHGIPKADCKSLRQRYAPTFDADFDLQCPKLDETMVRYWKQAVGKDWRSNLNDFQEKSWQSVQYQMLDSFRPLLRTWNQLPEDSPFLNDVEATLQLLGSAFAGISKLRRSNAMRHVAPELLPLLKDERMFSAHEYERLFGDKFLTAMVKDADDFEKVKKFAGRSGGPITKRSENRSSSGQSGHGYRSGDNRYQLFSSGSRSSGRSYPTSTLKQQHTSRYVSQSSVSTTVIPIAGRLSFFGDAWSTLSADPWILSTVMEGYHIEFVALPFQEQIPTGCIMSKDMETVSDQEIKLLLEKGAIAPIPSDNTDGFVSNLFVIPKKSGGWRPIINLKHLN